MHILTALAIFFAQPTQPQGPDPLPPRAYQPTLVDPGLDGERPGGSLNGDLTPDGKLLIAYRNTRVPTGRRIALIAAVVRPERLQTNADDYLTKFYDYDGTTAANFTFGALNLNLPQPEQAVIHYMWIPDPADPCDQDPNYPIEVNPHITVALRERDGGNPYRSDEFGTPVNAGAFSTYKIWIVRTHATGFEGHVTCGANPNLEPLVVPNADTLNPMLEFVCQDVTVVIDEEARSVVHTSVDSLPYQFITTSSPVNRIRGLEPSVTSDGRLILYHGNGNGSTSFPGDGNVTYIYNPNGCQATGWTTPRTIAELPTFTDDVGGLTAAEKAEQFKLRYKIFARPLRMPPISVQGGAYPYSNGYEFKDGIGEPASDSVRGLYLWVSKDGSHYVAACAGATEASEVSDPEGPGPRTRAGNYICGDITGGYVKHIDDVGINPTRRGGPWNWPPRQTVTDSWRTMQFSTGIKPGLWEPLPGQGAPLPTQIASARIPVLPLFESSIDSYGEVRCEEMDGNYLLYMACNESLMLADQLADYEVGSGRTTAPGECDVIFDLNSTPDTSGRPTRARCVLNSGAAFPQEVVDSSATLRSGVGAALGPGLGLSPTVSLHENVGFKGQAIVFNSTGNVFVSKVAGNPGFFIAGLQRFTAQLFVKVVGLPATTLTLLEYGGLQGSTADPAFTLKLNTNGKFTAHVDTTTGGLTANSRTNALPFNQSLYDSRTGWRHVAVTFDGDSNGYSRLRIYLDGQLEWTSLSNTTSAVRTPLGSGYYAVGPGRTFPPNPIDDGDKLLVIDEVAVSDILRGVGELRRDAYVPALPGNFGDWPIPEPSLPMSLDIEEGRWPVGVAYDADVANLGRDLFDHVILSVSGTSACATCHIPTENFADEDQPSVAGVLNIPTLFNAGFGTHKLFDGSASSLEDQVWRPITGGEMGPQSVNDVLGRLNQVGSPFATRFTDPATFGEPADQANVAEAIAMYIRTLNSGGSAFDNQLWAEDHGGVYLFGFPVMTQDQKDGSALFFGKARCVACHRGTNFSDDDFHNVLTVKTNEGTTFRGTLTGRAADAGRLKTPTLRNVQHTAPYFHDGSAGSLADVIAHYNEPPFGATDRVGTADIDLRPLELTPDEMHDLEEFLKALSGTLP